MTRRKHRFGPLARAKPLVVTRPASPNKSAESAQFDGSPQALGQLESAAKAADAPWLLFECNEQGGWPIAAVNRRLGTGYSSFSGIDAKDWNEQTRQCWNDWKACEKGKPVRLPWAAARVKAAKPAGKARGSFSLLFDTEQLGGVRFGLPRILALLAKKNVRATFFLTGVVAEVYPGLVQSLKKAGHEVGIHGLWHEYLQSMGAAQQKKRIQACRESVGGRGANFIGRMNRDTVLALQASGMRYFVFPMKNNRRFGSSYSPPLWLREGLWAVPVFAETYGKTWPAIRQELERTLDLARGLGQRPELAILGHPFFDGSRERLPVLGQMIDWLQSNDLAGIRLDESLPEEAKSGPGSLALKPYGASGWKGLLERLENSRTLNAYSLLIRKNYRPQVECR